MIAISGNPIFIFSALLLLLALIKLTLFVTFASKHDRRHRRTHPTKLAEELPLVSVIIPAYNEELTLGNCIKGLLKQNYPKVEIVIVNDGSTDHTLQVARKLAQEHEKSIRVLTKKNGGKATALNYGIGEAAGEIIVCIDADSIFLPNTVEQLVISMRDPAVAAVGGNVRVINRHKTLNKHQAVEYITGLTLQRRAFAHIGCMQVISGAIGAFRKSALQDIGGYSTDTIVEDMDITIELIEHKYKVVFNPNAIAYTEAPETIADFIKQRYRWTYGGFQAAAKHKHLLFKRGFNKMGAIGLPYFVIFPWVDVFVSLLLIFGLVRAVILHDGAGLLIFYAAMSCLQAMVAAYALYIDKENKKLALWAGIDSLFYNHLISYTTLLAGINYLRKRKTTWNKLKRYGKNTLPIPAVESR